MRLVDALERADIPWCAIGGVAVNHWAKQPMVTQDVDFVVTTEAIERTVAVLEQAGFKSGTFEWSINFRGRSAVSLKLSTEDVYRDFPSRAVAADVHGILMRVASLDDTLKGKVLACGDAARRQKQTHQGSCRRRAPRRVASRAVASTASGPPGQDREARHLITGH